MNNKDNYKAAPSYSFPAGTSLHKEKKKSETGKHSVRIFSL